MTLIRPRRRAAQLDDQSLPVGEEKVQTVDDMFDRIAARYELCNRVLTFGMDARWRRLAVRTLALPNNSVVLDIACGTADLCRDLAAAGLRPVGIDRSDGMLRAARGVTTLVRGDALSFPVADGSADGVVCGFALRNFTSVDPFFAATARALRPGGRLVVLEVDRPRSRVMQAGHALYFRRVVPLIGGMLSDRDAYQYLPRSVAYLPPTDSLLTMLAQHGFTQVSYRPLSGGIAQMLSATRAKR